METRDFTVRAAKTTVRCQLAIPDGEKVKGNLVIFLAHGANYKWGMHSPVIEALHDLLARRGFVTVRFNFAFVENGHKTKDNEKELVAVYKAVVKKIQEQDPAAIIFGGFSLGSLVAMQLHKKMQCDGLLFLGFPLHDKKRKPIPYEIDAQVPALFCSGADDWYADAKHLTLVVEQLRKKGEKIELFFVNDVGHSFQKKQHNLVTQKQIYLDLVEMIDNWISHHWY